MRRAVGELTQPPLPMLRRHPCSRTGMRCGCSSSLQTATRRDHCYEHTTADTPALVQVLMFTIYVAVVVAVSTGAAAHAVYTMWTTSNWTLRHNPWAALPISLAVYICVPVCLLLLSLILPQHRFDVLINNRFVGAAALAMVGAALASIPASHIVAMC